MIIIHDPLGQTLWPFYIHLGGMGIPGAYQKTSNGSAQGILAVTLLIL